MAKETLLNQEVDLDQETDTQKIQKQFGIQTNCYKETFGAQVADLCSQDNAYLAFKKSANLDKTLLKFNEVPYKPSQLSEKDIKQA